MEIGGSIFYDIYAELTGSRIAYGGCYDRNDYPEKYCVTYPEDEDFCNLIDVCDNGSVTSKNEYCRIPVFLIFTELGVCI
jgi:hypothetical protein